jgi:hypothetical protein
MNTNAYRLVAAPKFAAMSEWDCTRCGRAEVKPVFLADASGVAAYGSGCAARLLGRPASAGRKVVDEAAALDRREAELEAMRAERRDAYTAALSAFAVRDDEVAELLRARRTFHQAGGFEALGSFPSWLARVAETGELAA